MSWWHVQKFDCQRLTALLLLYSGGRSLTVIKTPWGRKCFSAPCFLNAWSPWSHWAFCRTELVTLGCWQFHCQQKFSRPWLFDPVFTTKIYSLRPRIPRRGRRNCTTTITAWAHTYVKDTKINSWVSWRECLKPWIAYRCVSGMMAVINVYASLCPFGTHFEGQSRRFLACSLRY